MSILDKIKKISAEPPMLAGEQVYQMELPDRPSMGILDHIKSMQRYPQMKQRMRLNYDTPDADLGEHEYSLNPSGFHWNGVINNLIRPPVAMPQNRGLTPKRLYEDDPGWQGSIQTPHAGDQQISTGTRYRLPLQRVDPTKRTPRINFF